MLLITIAATLRLLGSPPQGRARIGETGLELRVPISARRHPDSTLAGIWGLNGARGVRFSYRGWVGYVVYGRSPEASLAHFQHITRATLGAMSKGRGTPVGRLPFTTGPSSPPLSLGSGVALKDAAGHTIAVSAGVLRYRDWTVVLATIARNSRSNSNLSYHFIFEASVLALPSIRVAKSTVLSADARPAEALKYFQGLEDRVDRDLNAYHVGSDSWLLADDWSATTPYQKHVTKSDALASESQMLALFPEMSTKSTVEHVRVLDKGYSVTISSRTRAVFVSRRGKRRTVIMFARSEADFVKIGAMWRKRTDRWLSEYTIVDGRRSSSPEETARLLGQ